MRILLSLITIAILSSCGGSKPAADVEEAMAGPEFCADSAMAFCQAQCDFGPRVMNSEAHERCAEWIAARFRQYGCDVQLQQATLTGYDGTPLRSTNIIATSPSLSREGQGGSVLICAHYDSRPWADNDRDEANHRKPVMAANDGASGVGVMLELARLLQQADSARVNVTFVCFDAEDWGTPQWADVIDNPQSWALGAQHWSRHNTTPFSYGILLDMVGGLGARFYQEANSMDYAPQLVKRVWRAAEVTGYGSMFPHQYGGRINDDHVPVNEVAGIPCIDIIPYYPDCEASGFGPTWHTVNDDMQHLDPATLKAVGQTLVQVIYGE